ncbi:hypothetical protein BGX27_003290 [Mortierella sp. AM989]|nr:hypothetical protein BGX27_003290 [Mortierella sp. AM989]
MKMMKDDTEALVPPPNERPLQQIYKVIQASLSSIHHTAIIPASAASAVTSQLESQAPHQTQKQKQKKGQDGDERAAAPRIPDIITWKDAVQQWESGDIEKGLSVPLKLRTPRMRKTEPSRYSQRKLIAMEFNLLHKSDKNMRDIHGGAVDLVSNLITSIRFHKRERKRSSLGTGGKPQCVERDEEEEEAEEEEGEEDSEETEEEEDQWRRKRVKP